MGGGANTVIGGIAIIGHFLEELNLRNSPNELFNSQNVYS